VAFLNPSNQLIQIDTGKARTYLFNANVSPISVYANLGEIQVPGQRYFSLVNATAANPYGAPAIYELVYYKSTAQPAPVAAPAPVWWTDETFTTVTGVYSESFGGLSQMAAGYLMPNTTDLTGLTAALLQGALLLIQVAGLLPGGYAPTTTPGAGNWITGSAGNWTSTGGAGAPTSRPFGVQLAAAVAGVADILVTSDII